MLKRLRCACLLAFIAVAPLRAYAQEADTTATPSDTTDLAPDDRTGLAPYDTTAFAPLDTAWFAPFDTTFFAPFDTTLFAPFDTTDVSRLDTTGAAPADTARTREVDVSADLLEGGIEGGERIRRLIGNVRLRQEDTQLRARRAVQYLDRREILFTGNVLVVERGDTLRADSVLYNSREKTGRASGNVRLSDGDVLVEAPSGIYFTREKRARFTDGVRLIDSTAVLTSRGGEYWSDEKRAEFFGEVVLTEDRTYLEADSVTYLREDDVSHARGSVFIERYGEGDAAEPDTLTRSLLFGDQAYNEDSTAYSRAEGNPLLVQLRRDSVEAEVDTLVIRARLLESSTRDSLQRLVAVDSVRIWQSDLSAIADSVVYDRITAAEGPRRERVGLFGGPVAWFQENQVSGDTLHVRGRDGSIDSLLVRSNAFVARRDSALDKIQQLRGQHLVAVFERDSLRILDVGPRAEAINFRSESDGAAGGAVRMSADQIVFHFRGDDLDRLEAVRDAEGTYYSEDLLPEDLRLDGFLWIPERRPEKPQLLRNVQLPVPNSGVAANPYTEPPDRTH